MTNFLDSLSTEILLDIFRRQGPINAVSYRADHDDWIEKLDELEQRQLLIREGGDYRIALAVLTLLDDNDAIAECKQCERLFDILRQHYKDGSTRDCQKFLSNLAEETHRTYEETLRAMWYLLDASSLWMGGRSSVLDDPKTAYVKPSEGILSCKCFADLIVKVQAWYKPEAGSFDRLDGVMSPPFNGCTPEDIKTSLQPAPVVLSFLYDLKSTDTIVRIVSRAGLMVDWSLSKAQDYSEKTRLRAYMPRIDAALKTLGERDGIAVATSIAREMIVTSPDIATPLDTAMRRIGWQISDGELVPCGMDIGELFFPNGAEHTAYVKIRSILENAKHRIDVIDPYVDSSILVLLKALPRRSLVVRLLTAKPPADFKLEVEKFKKEIPSICLEVRANRDFHDRFIVLDRVSCFHIGASVKDAGQRAFMISRMEDSGNVSALLGLAEEKWASATLI